MTEHFRYNLHDFVVVRCPRAVEYVVFNIIKILKTTHYLITFKLKIPCKHYYEERNMKQLYNHLSQILRNKLLLSDYYHELENLKFIVQLYISLGIIRR